MTGKELNFRPRAPAVFATTLMLIFLATFSQAAFEEDLIFTPNYVSITSFPGESTETMIHVKSTLNSSITLVAASAIGGLRDVVNLENTQVSIEPYSEGNLKLRIYVYHKTPPGSYRGELTLTTGSTVVSLPAAVKVMDQSENVTISLSLHTFSDVARPGKILKVQADVHNPGENKVDAQIDVSLVDPASKRVIIKESQNISISESASTVFLFNIPENIIQKDYNVEGVAYYLSGSERGKLRKASATLKVSVKQSASDIAEGFFQTQVTAARIQFLIASIPVIIIAVLYYLHYKKEQLRKKRYLESIDFESLPRPEKRAAYIGRIAETKLKAFGDLDVLQMHSLVAGATGSGKTVAAQVIVEEALLKGVGVMVFDPTAQWTGFLRKCNTRNMLRLYPNFNMKTDDARAFNGNIHVVKTPHDDVDVKRFMNPGEINVFCMHKLSPQEIDLYVEKTVRDVFRANLDEVSGLRLLIVYDEVHRLLPKFGGSGRGFIQIERAAREFRKWGVGLVLVSQVLSDFVGEIKANIGTEIQMRTRYERDLERVKMKYGEDIMKSIVKASVGTGMIQNAEYNRGKPYFVSFRPLLHTPYRLSDSELVSYDKFNVELDSIKTTLDELKFVGVDVFDLELELNLALENVKKGSFNVVELYTESLKTRVGDLTNSLNNPDKKKLQEIRDSETRRREKEKEKNEAERRMIDEEARKLTSMIASSGEQTEWGHILDEYRKDVVEEGISEEEKKLEKQIHYLESLNVRVQYSREEIERRRKEITDKIEKGGLG